MLTQSTFQRSQRIAILMLILLLLGATWMPPGSTPALALSTGTVVWDDSPAILTAASDTIRSNFPWVTVDKSDHTHIVYIRQTATSGSWSIRYMNNVSGSFSSPGTEIDTIPNNPAVPSAIIMAGSNNVLHLLYALTKTDDQIYYRRSTDNGATWSARQQISSSGKSAAPSMVIDSSNNAYITWISNSCGQYNVYYRERLDNGTLTSVSKPKESCDTYQNRPSITLANSKPQIVFQHGTSSDGDVYYARLEGSTWVSQNISSGAGGGNSQNPAFASDGGNNLFAAWDENISNHEIFFRASFDGGSSWSDFARFTTNDGISTYPYIAWSATTQRAFISWHDQGDVDGASEEIWLREFNPSTKETSAAFQMSHTSKASKLPNMAFGASRADLVWHDNTNTNYQIYDLVGKMSGSCSGTLTLAGGATQTNSTSVPATISSVVCPDGGTPDSMQISVDSAPSSLTDPAPVSYSANTSVSIAGGSCSQHTVYVRLIQNSSAGSTFTANIMVDNSVDAKVQIVNPYLSGLPTVYTPVSVSDLYGTGATDGDPSYTRVRKFFLGISNNADCTGLAEYYVPNSDSTQPEAIPDTGFSGAPALPGFGDPGSKEVTVVVTDTIGNQQTYGPTTLIYDPDKPTLNSGGSFSGDENTKTIIRTLTFSGVNVDDTIYGQYQSLSAGQQFWGVWLANVDLSATPNITSDNPGLTWGAVEVPTPASQFSMQWSLYHGLNYGSSTDHSGSYRIFARFLDGAGNPTDDVISTTLTLDSGYTIPQTFLPVVLR